MALKGDETKSLLADQIATDLFALPVIAKAAKSDRSKSAIAK